MTALFLLLLRPALMCVEGGSRKPHHMAAALVAWVLDIFIAHTTWRLLAGPLQGRERTISDSLERLCKDTDHPDWALFYSLSIYINRVSPTGEHIKSAKSQPPAEFRAVRDISLSIKDHRNDAARS